MKTPYASPILREVSKMAGLHPDKIAIQEDQKKLTYSQLMAEVNRISELLRSRGIREGDRLVLPVENRVDSIVTILGIMGVRATAVLLDPRLPLADLHRLIVHSDPISIIASKHVIKDLNPDLIMGISVWEIDNQLEPDAKFPSGKPLADFLDNDPDIAVIIYTSGTSGDHKGVMLSHDNLLAGANIMTCDLDGSKEFYCILPIYHIYSLTSCVINPLVHGGSMRLIALENVFKVFDTKVPVVVPLVPRMLDYILTKIKADPALKNKVEKQDRKLIQFTSGGSPLSEKLEKAYEELGYPLTRGYGLSETCGVGAISQPRAGITGGIGPVSNKMELKIYHPDEKGGGEILIRGPTVMKGYFRNPRATSEAIVDGWFHSGDLGYFNQEGILFITGRSKDVIVLPTGEKAMPDNIESHYAKIPGVKEICVFGLNAKGQVYDEIHAAIVPENKEISLQEIESRVNEKGSKLPFHLQIQKIHLITELPKTSVQKVRRALIREMIKKETGGKAAVTSITDEPLYNWLREWLAKIADLSPNEIDETRPFTYYGVDSLNIWLLCESLSQEFQVSISPMNVMENSTLIKLAEFCKANLHTNQVAKIPPLFVADRSKDLPLSFPEEIHWQRAQFPWQNYFYGISLEGALNIDILKNAFETLFQRNEIFRTTYQKKGDRLFRHIEPHSKVELKVFDLSQQSDQEQEFQKIVRSYREKLIDIKVLPLVNLAVISFSESKHVLLFLVARLIADGMSLVMMVEDVAHYYHQLVAGQKITFAEPLEFQYADYANWQRTLYEQRIFQEEEEYWKKQFRRMALVNIPDKKRTLSREEQLQKDLQIAGVIPIVISGDISKKLAEISSEINSYLQTLLAAVLQVALHIHTKDSRISIRELNVGRKKPHLKRMFGYLNNGLPIVADFSNDRSFKDLLTAHQKQLHLATSLPYFEVICVYKKIGKSVFETHRRLMDPLFGTDFEIFSKIDLFEGIGIQELKLLYSISKEIDLKKNDILIHENEKAEELFIITDGTLEITKVDPEEHSDYVINTLSKGDVVGEISFIDRGFRSATVKAKSDAKVRSISYKVLEEFVQKSIEFSPIYFELAKNITHRLRKTSKVTYEALKKEVEETKTRVYMGSFLLTIITVLCLFAYALNELESLLAVVPNTSYIAIPLTLLIGVSLMFMIIYSPLKWSQFGVTLHNWKRSIYEGFVYTIPVLAFLVLLKWLLIQFNPSYANEAIFNPYSLIADPKDHNFHYWLVLNGVYCLFLVPIQELLTRGVLQSLLEYFLIGKHRVLMSIVLSNLIFGSVHLFLAFDLSVMIFGAGLFIGWIYSRTHNIISSSISHALLGVWALSILGVVLSK